jgi:hypothetical protein
MAKSKGRSTSKPKARPAAKADAEPAKPQAAPQVASVTAPAAVSTPTPAAAAGGPRRVVWPHVITVISATILIGAEVFGAAFAGSWALATLFGFGFLGARILDVILMLCGLGVMVQFVRSAHLIEPFTARG